MPFFYFFDYSIIFLIPALIFGAYASYKVQSTYKRYSTYSNAHGYTAAEVARRILDDNGLQNVKIAHIKGDLTDNYNPKTNVVSLSDSVYSSTSVAAIGVAAHECGHAIQHAVGYSPIKLRSALVPLTNFGSSAGMIILLIGLLFASYQIAMFGVLLYSLMAVFQAVTLPVEYNASSRALKTLERDGILYDDELPAAKKVLNAAALTYVAALVSTVSTILRLLFIVGSRTDRGGRRR